MFMCKIYLRDGIKHTIEHFDKLTVLSVNSEKNINEQGMLSSNFSFSSKTLCFSSDNYSFRVSGADVLYFEIFKIK